MTTPLRFAVLRQDAEWPGARLDGLQADLDGTLTLLPLPATDPFDGPAGPVPASGIAVDPAGDLYLTDTPGNRLLRDDLLCHSRQVAGSLTAHATPAVAEFHGPAGLSIGPCGWLFVADTLAGRIVLHTRPGLARRAVWRDGLRSPVAVAGDGDDALIVADPGRGQVLRLRPTGEPDVAVNRRFAQAPGRAPAGLAVGPDGLVYVADADQLGVARFSRDGEPAGEPLVPGRRPSALALAGGILYVADELSSQILLVDLTTGHELGAVGGFRGSVSALTASDDGRVWIKPGPGPDYLLAEPGRSCAPSGSLISGPHDAGADATWFRVNAAAEAGEGTAVVLETGFGATGPGLWHTEAAHDVLLENPGRHLWVRLRLSRRDDAPEAATPRLRQVTAAIADRGFASQLPDVYRDDGASDLERMVALTESSLADLEDVVGQLSRTVDPLAATRRFLPWLAAWQGFELPARATTLTAMREVMHRIPDLNERRGTCSGLIDLIELHTGVKVLVFERFADRGIWFLGQSCLGTDTMLPPLELGGFVVGDGRLGESGPEDPANTGAELFDEWAHRITIIVPGAALTSVDQRLITDLVEREKPAHVITHICVTKPRLRVGVQARLGIDAVVGRHDAADRLGTARLDVDARSAGHGTTALTGNSHLGLDARLG